MPSALAQIQVSLKVFRAGSSMGAKKDPKKDAKTPSKTPKKKEGGGGKAKKKKWSKGKTRCRIPSLDERHMMNLHELFNHDNHDY